MRRFKVSSSFSAPLRFISVLIAIVLTLPLGRGAHAQANQAGLVVQFADGSVREFCVDLGGPERTGEELLRLSGLDVVAEVSAQGTLVCRIGGTGCDYPAQSCQCQCEDMAAGCTTWSYNVLQGGRWRYSRVGAQARVVRPGDVDGWAWGPSTVQQGAEPPLRSFEQLCAAQSEASPAPSATPTRTPRPTRTVRPSATPRPTVTRPSPSPPPGATARPSPTERAGDTATVSPAAPLTGGAGTPSPASAAYPEPFGSTATALAQVAKTEFAALVESMPAEPQRMSAATVAEIETQSAAASAEAAATAAPTLAAVAIIEGMDEMPSKAPGSGSTGASFGSYLVVLLVALVLGGAWWWLRRGQSG